MTVEALGCFNTQAKAKLDMLHPSLSAILVKLRTFAIFA